MRDKCRFCGNESVGISFVEWVKPTFTDHDKLLAGDIICDNCLFWFDERSGLLAEKVGKEKPQRMRNYSHFVVNGEWEPLSKGSKNRMKELLLGQPFPELAAVAQSGQKHIVFRAIRNPVDAQVGWVQFEEQRTFVKPSRLAGLLEAVEALYVVFSKGEIGSGDYKGYRALKFGLSEWQRWERKIKSLRGSLIFELALFLAQRGGNDDTRTREGSRPAGDRLAGNTERLQEPLSNEHLETIRGCDPQRGVHEQPGQVRQLSMLEIPGQFGPQR